LRGAAVSASHAWSNCGVGFVAAAVAPRNPTRAASVVPSMTTLTSCAARSSPTPRRPWRHGGSGAPQPRGRRSVPRRFGVNANGSICR
jgi:hypothetical protein